MGVELMRLNEYGGLFVAFDGPNGVGKSTLVEYVQLYQHGAVTKEARKELLLEEHRRLNERIVELQAVKERLLYKINNYDQLEESVVIMNKDNW